MMLGSKFQKRLGNVIPKSTEKNSFPALWHSAVGSVQKKKLRSVSDFAKSIHDELGVAFSVAEDHAFHIFSDGDFGL